MTRTNTMGCCGDSDDDDLWEHLIMSARARARPQFTSGTDETPAEEKPEIPENSTTESPSEEEEVEASSESSSLPKDLWRTVLGRLNAAELGRAACVCRTWNAIVSDDEMQMNAFKAPWKLKEIVGRPSSRSFWHGTTLARFAISHKLERSDTMAGLALKYQVHVTDIRRVNNMMSDHGIYSRERLLIPVSNPDILTGATCYIELDTHAKREVAVLYLDGAPDKSSYLPNNMPEKSKRRLLESVKRSLQTDDGTAEYYLSISNGDLRTAFAQFSQDLRWEEGHEA